MKNIQKITADLSQIACPFGTRPHAARVESGPLQINDDWPGVFIRGDNAFTYVMYLNLAIAALEKMENRENLFTIGTLKDLVNLLASSRV